MNDPNSFGYQEAGSGPGPQPQPTTPMAQYKFSQDEMRVLQECNRESFFQRSLPFGVLLGLGTGAAVQQGYLKPNPRFGAFPKVTLAVVVGYFVGKLSYQQACADKLMALPGSYIGQLLRDRRDGKISGGGMGGGAGAGTGPASMLGATAGDIYSDAGPGSALDLDSDRPLFSEDLTRPDTVSPGGGGAGGVPSGGGAEGGAPPLSYDELRRKNRGAYADTKRDPYRVDENAAPSVRRAPLPRPTPTPNTPPATNQYGDVVE